MLVWQGNSWNTKSDNEFKSKELGHLLNIFLLFSVCFFFHSKLSICSSLILFEAIIFIIYLNNCFSDSHFYLENIIFFSLFFSALYYILLFNSVVHLVWVLMIFFSPLNFCTSIFKYFPVIKLFLLTLTLNFVVKYSVSSCQTF